MSNISLNIIVNPEKGVERFLILFEYIFLSSNPENPEKGVERFLLIILILLLILLNPEKGVERFIGRGFHMMTTM